MADELVVYAAHCGRISASEGENGTELIHPSDGRGFCGLFSEKAAAEAAIDAAIDSIVAGLGAPYRSWRRWPASDRVDPERLRASAREYLRRAGVVTEFMVWVPAGIPLVGLRLWVSFNSTGRWAYRPVGSPFFDWQAVSVSSTRPAEDRFAGAPTSLADIASGELLCAEVEVR